jgi:predicted extracellular nuclease/plastocyanin/subtilisin-like proprotein convertase family protein
VGTDAGEFVELYDGGLGNTSLTGLVVVFYNGSNDLSYAAFDLDGYSTNVGGYFTLGNAGVPGVDLVFPGNFLQNGQDAVALYVGDGSQFPNNTPVTTTNLLDAVVYDTADPDDPGLLVLLNPGQPQVDEDAGGNGVVNSIQRCPNGSGGQRNTNTYAAFGPNPDSLNTCTPAPTGTATNTVVVTPSATNTPGGPTATPTATFGVGIRIREIQGATHRSPYEGQIVNNVPGIVTARGTNGFWMQDPTADANDATSEAIFVFTSTAPPVNVGDSVLVSGNVAEFRPGGATSTNLTTTELTSPTITILSSGNALPTAVVIGTGGRIPPTMVIDDDATGDVETSGTFDAATDGIDFYESMEAMRVQVNNPVAVSPTNGFGEIAVLGDDGANASVRTPRGGIIIRQNDFNPERIIIDDVLTSTPDVNVGDHFSGPALGVMDYSFGNFKLLITQALTRVAGPIARETTTVPGPNQLAVGTFNVENLDPGDGQAKFDALAGLIVNNLKSPDILAIEEIQDNNGPTNDGTVAADITYNMLIAAIQSAGGPTYQFRQIDPLNNQDGGEPGGNIRVGFLFRTDRGVAFVDRPGGNATRDTLVLNGPNGPYIDISPGRVRPTATAFANSRKPLAGEFTYNGHTLFLVANHFNSKGGDHPLFGRFQPPVLSSEVQRTQQAQIVNDFVDQILAFDANAKVIVLGDLNDFEWSTPILTLTGGVMQVLIERLPQPERYSYVFDGNSQTLDHIVVSNAISNTVPLIYDVLHLNAEFFDQDSDHDPSVAFFTLPAGATATPTATAAASTATRTNTAVPTSTRTNTVVLPTPTCAPPGTTDVSIIDLAFVPQGVTVTVGSSVRWTNNGQLPHTSTSNTGVWNSGTLNNGQQYTYTFNTPGTYLYHCAIHPEMEGIIEVLAGNPCPTSTVAPPSATRTNTAVPPTSTRTNTAVAATATRTNTAAIASPTGTVCVQQVLLIPDWTNDRVMAFDPTTGNLMNPDFIPSDPAHLSSPKNAILSAAGNTILVSDQIEDVVQEYSLSGTFIRTFAPAGGPNPAILDNILGIMLRPNGNLLVTVTGGANQDAVAEFDTNGNYLGNFIATGSGGLDGPFDILLRTTVTDTDYLVSAINSDNILRYDVNGSFLGLFAPVNNFPQQLNPSRIAGNTLNANFSGTQVGVLEFDHNGTPVAQYTPVTGNRGVYDLPNGNILTTDDTGVHEINRAGQLVSTKISGVNAQYIELVNIAGSCATFTPAPTGTATATRTVTLTRTVTRTRTVTATRTNTAIATVTGTATRTSTPGVCQITEYKSSDVPKTIGPTNPVTSTLTITGSGALDKVEVSGIVITHTYASDLDVYLISPQGTRVELFTDICGGDAWRAGNTYFDLNPRASNLIGSRCPPRSGSSTAQIVYRPEGDLDTLVGQSANGVWTLEITDDFPKADDGVLYGWGLRISRGGACPTKTPGPILPTPIPTGSVQ